MSRRKQSHPKPIKRPEDEEEDNSVGLSQPMDQADDNGNDANSPSHNSPDHDGENIDDCHSDRDNCDDREYTPMEDINSDGVASDTELGKSQSKSYGGVEGSATDAEQDIEVEANQVNGAAEVKVENGQIVEKDISDDDDDSMLKQQLMKKLFFPKDLLTLRKVDEAEFTVTGIPWSVLSKVELRKGQRLGPFSGELVALSSIKPGELVLQFQTRDGDLSFIKVTDEAGAWLSLLKPSEHSSAHNICVYFEYGKVWCEVEEDVKSGVELIASFTTTSTGPSSIPQDRDLAALPSGSKKHESKSIPQLSPQHALIYGCPFCTVRFSSPRTLEAHLTYYCSKKPSDFVSLQQLQQRLEQQVAAAAAVAASDIRTPETSQGTPSPKVKTELTSPRTKLSASERSESADGHVSDRESPASKSDDIFKCHTCSFVCESPSGLAKHQQSHGRSTPGDSPICQEEMFCKQCNIQFSSLSTYRGHKEFYCQYRLRPSSCASDDSESATTAAAREILKSPNVFIDAKGNLVPGKAGIHSSLLIPGLLNQSPFLLQAMSKDMPYYLKGLEREAVNASMKAATDSRGGKTAENVARHEDQPLDLSTGKQQAQDSMEEETMERSELKTPERVLRFGVKSEPRSPDSSELCSPVKKQKLDSSSDEPLRPSMKATLNIPTIPTILSGPGPVQFVNKKPIPPLQMVSRCVECNIVFYKHENYLIHKEHYCSGRRVSKDTSSAESDMSETDGKETEAVPVNRVDIAKPDAEPLARRHMSGESLHNETEPPVQGLNQSELYGKHFCIPCKIRFSSAGTLKAHTDFYCPHGKENAKGSGKEKRSDGTSMSADENGYHCDNCKSDFPSARLLKLHICMGESSPSPLLRCLYCDYVTQTEHRLSEHLKVHLPTKAFKCNLCGYRGNTARGMRMHGKVHIENGEEFTDDNMREFEEPPLVPVQKNIMPDKGPVDMETELIRMKNEPYKRRRSRKSFEKSENMVPLLGPTMLPQTSCVACGQTFGNLSDFVIHLKMHEIAALEAMKNSAKNFHCEHCSDFVAGSLTSLLVHMQSKHPEQLPGNKSESEADSRSRSEGERSQSRDSHTSHDRSHSGSEERIKREYSITADSDTSRNGEQNRKVDASNVKSETFDDNITEPNIKTVNKHIANGIDSDIKDLEKCKKSPNSGTSHPISDVNGSQHSASSTNGHSPSLSPCLIEKSPDQSPNPSNQNSPSNNSPWNKASSPDQSTSSSKTNNQSNQSNHSSPKQVSIKEENNISSPRRFSPDPKTRYLQSQNSVKKEQISPPLVLSPRSQPASPRTPSASPKLRFPQLPHSPKLQNLSLLYNPQAMLALYQYPTSIPTSLIAPHHGIIPPTVAMATSPGDKNGRKYCKHCDINFTYLSSFLTHKKYYCSARTSSPEESESPTATV